MNPPTDIADDDLADAEPTPRWTVWLSRAYTVAAVAYVGVGTLAFMTLTAVLAVLSCLLLPTALFPVSVFVAVFAIAAFEFCVDGLRALRNRPVQAIGTVGSGALLAAACLPLALARQVEQPVVQFGWTPLTILCSVHWTLFLLCRGLRIANPVLDATWTRPAPQRGRSQTS